MADETGAAKGTDPLREDNSTSGSKGAGTMAAKLDPRLDSSGNPSKSPVSRGGEATDKT